MTDFAAVISTALGVILVFGAAMYSYKVGRATLLSWAYISVACFLCFAFVASIQATSASNDYSAIIAKSSRHYLVYPLYVLVLSAGMAIGWGILSGFLKNREARVKRRIIIQQGTARFHVAGWIALTVGMAATYFYAKNIGGLVGSLEFASQIRAGFLVENRWSFLKPFAGMSVTCFLLFCALIGSGRPKFFIWLGVSVSAIFYLYFAMMGIGRVTMLFSLAVLVLLWVHSKGWGNYKVILMSPAFAVVGVYLMFSLSQQIGVKSRATFSEFVAAELSFPAASFFAHYDLDTQTRWFYDFMVAPAYLLPSSWNQKFISDPVAVNTKAIFGAEKGSYGVTAAVPVDILTLGYLQMSVFGIFFVGVLFAGALRLAQYVADYRLPNFIVPAATSYFVLRLAVAPVIYADPSTLMGHLFGMIATICVIWAVSLVARIQFRVT